MKIKYAIFDFDGTLFDSMQAWVTAGEKYLSSIGIKIRAKKNIYDDIKNLSLDQSARYFKKNYKLNISLDEIITGIKQTVADFYLYKIKPKSGVYRFLEMLDKKNINMCIATSADEYQVRMALKRCKLNIFFREIFSCDKIGFGKDRPVIYCKALEYFNAKRENTVVFEDAYYAIKTAKNDGFITIGVFDKSEDKQTEIKKICDCYLMDFKNTDSFWELC